MKTEILAIAVLLCSVEASHKPRHSKVLILGAGTSGIKAAEVLHSEGIKDFLILEGEDYIGGRIHSGPTGRQYELGAGRIINTGAHNPVWKLSKKLGLKMEEEQYDDFIVRGTTKSNPKGIWKQLQETTKIVEMKLKARNKCGQADVPLRSVLGMAGWHPVSGVERALEFHKYDLKSGAPSEMLSSIHHGSEKESTDATVNDPKGLQHVLKYIAEPFKNKIIFKTLVTEIQNNASMVTVVTANGTKYFADHVLVTFSPGVLTNNIVKFNPMLPTWKMDALYLRPMAHQCKIYLQFPRRFWENKKYILFAKKHSDAPAHWEFTDKSKGISKYSTLLLTLTGDQCVKSEGMTDKEVVANAMEALRSVYGTNIPAPKGIIRKAWGKSVKTLGSYSYPAVGLKREDVRKLALPVGRLWFAGDYISNDIGTVVSAYLSGKRASKNMLTCIRLRQCPRWRPSC